MISNALSVILYFGNLLLSSSYKIGAQGGHLYSSSFIYFVLRAMNVQKLFKSPDR